jgi:hypothetical protein
MWQGRQNICATQKESFTENQQISAFGYIPDTAEIVIASESLFQQHGAAEF